MILAFAAARAATPFGVTCAYFALIGRIVEIVAAAIEKPVVGWVGYGISAFFMIILFFVAMAHDAD